MIKVQRNKLVYRNLVFYLIEKIIFLYFLFWGIFLVNAQNINSFQSNIIHASIGVIIYDNTKILNADNKTDNNLISKSLYLSGKVIVFDSIAENTNEHTRPILVKKINISSYKKKIKTLNENQLAFRQKKIKYLILSLNNKTQYHSFNEYFSNNGIIVPHQKDINTEKINLFIDLTSLTLLENYNLIYFNPKEIIINNFTRPPPTILLYRRS